MGEPTNTFQDRLPGELHRKCIVVLIVLEAKAVGCPENKDNKADSGEDTEMIEHSRDIIKNNNDSNELEENVGMSQVGHRVIVNWSDWVLYSWCVSFLT